MAFPRAATGRVARRTAEQCDQLVVASRFSASEFATEALLVRLGVDLDAFRPPIGLPPAPSITSPLRLVTVIRLSAEKRPDLPIETLRALRARGVPATVQVIGGLPNPTRRSARNRRTPPVVEHDQPHAHICIHTS